MSQLNPDKLHVTFMENTSIDRLILPRIYTLTHSDSSGDMTLTIGQNIMHKQISGWYTRFMRDEVWAEWIDKNDDFSLLVHCHVSGGLIFGSSAWRFSIFQHHMPAVLQAFRYGDRALFNCQPELEDTSIQVRYHSRQKKFNKLVAWHSFKAFR